ncbi:hypothetical protein CMK12_10635 [Candidatus Poribacteria bacterium]|nr:hypothetical protein [Candidatus Poribacteria bacterium]
MAGNDNGLFSYNGSKWQQKLFVPVNCIYMLNDRILMVGGSNSLLFFLKRKLLAEKNRFERANVAYILGLVNTINTIYKRIDNQHQEPESRKHPIPLVQPEKIQPNPFRLLNNPSTSFLFWSCSWSDSQGSRRFDWAGTTVENIKSKAGYRAVSPSSAGSIIIGPPAKGQSMSSNQPSPSGAS